MCGIAGVYHRDLDRGCSPELLERMVSVLQHRGPDDQGLYLDGGIALGARRLEIIDAAGAAQPLFNEDRTIAVVFNGEIYNFRELRAELAARGHRFSTVGDGEVIAHAYEEYGAGCVERLRGMFALAVWDQRRRELLLARDRVGIKPLYYHWDGRRLLFASEIKSILQDPTVSRAIDPLALDDYLTLHYIPAPKSIFTSIRKLPPAHLLRVSTAGLHAQEYWDIAFAPGPPQSDADAVAELRWRLREVVSSHLISDAPVGVFLSGGVDSSALAATMAELAGPIETVSMGFADRELNELHFSETVAGLCGARARSAVLEAGDVDILDALAWAYDEPFADSSMVPTWHLSRLARERLKVCLAGDGGDELFAGYPRFGRFVRLSEGDPRAAEREYFYRKTVKMPSLRRMYGSWLGGAVADYDPFSVFEPHFARARDLDPLSRVQYVEIKTYLVGDLLTKVDRASMAHGLEVRVPFLDHELIEYAARLPSAQKLRDGVDKFLLKEALRDRLPAKVLDRPKMGFSMPLARWLREDLSGLFERRALAEAMVLPELFDLEPIRQWWSEHRAGSHDHSRLLWSLLVLESWGRRFLVA